ncbi:MalY/PatB family protein [Tepidimicrobium xylanilyticum]|uniref:cysteine-S-conjugate beta-lyase n=1 Tax=Tepidimicrobium xylanilyticum TaxID=1123352 RepID=A0A1H2R777_9FIRM|nr:MalY/PatB family protein [Tepidimicrobium xylanilyticum]GMG95507.1 cystathionine beta-lyase [Tepidimicrobium xylanilyticum]SDW14704.1 cystathione beta-lyase [Tepidimicrobium xylanilyticum]
MHDFDRIVERRNTNSVKWDGLDQLYGREDLLPLWVADMDFPVAPAITEALKKRLEHGVYGYSLISNRYYEAVIKWMEKRHNWSIQKEWIVFTPGVVPALSYAVKAFTKPGDKVILQSPVYHPFYSSITDNGRHVVTNPLIYRDGKYYMDYEDLEKKIDSKTRLLFLCSPHNPVGRVWKEEELRKLGEICIKNDIIVVSDEIHFDIVFKGHKHTVFANVSEEIKENSIICTAPSKTFNIAGLQVSNIIIPNRRLRERFIIELEKDHILSPNIFGQEALIAAYEQSEDWLEQLIDYIEGNKDYFMDFVKENLPQLDVIDSEGTFLLWVDCSRLNMDSEELKDFFINKCRLALNQGDMFGEEGKLFYRFNIGCPRKIMEEALMRIKEGVESL